MNDAQQAALAGIRAKLLRAQSHLDRLRDEMEAFGDREPYSSDAKPNADGTKWVYRLKIRPPMPPVWGVVLGEVVHNLRSALDHAIFQLTIEYFGREIPGTGFPIFDDPAAWDKRGRTKRPDNRLGYERSCAMYQIRGVGPGIVEYVERLQPYLTKNPRGNPLLALHTLWNQDKHRLIHAWGLEIDKARSEIRYEGSNRPDTVVFHEGVLNDGDDAVTVTFASPAIDGKLHGKLATQVAFENPADPATGVDDALWRLYDATAAVVHSLLSRIGHQDETLA